MGIGDKGVILPVGAEARVDTVIVGGGIAVVRTARHIILEHGAEPDGCDAERIEIGEVVAHTLHVAAVAAIGIGAVGADGVGESLGSGALGIPLREAVGHQQIEHVAGVKAFVIFAPAVARLQCVS